MHSPRVGLQDCWNDIVSHLKGYPWYYAWKCQKKRWNISSDFPRLCPLWTARLFSLDLKGTLCCALRNKNRKTEKSLFKKHSGLCLDFCGRKPNSKIYPVSSVSHYLQEDMFEGVFCTYHIRSWIGFLYFSVIHTKKKLSTNPPPHWVALLSWLLFWVSRAPGLIMLPWTTRLCT